MLINNILLFFDKYMSSDNFNQIKYQKNCLDNSLMSFVATNGWFTFV